MTNTDAIDQWSYRRPHAFAFVAILLVLLSGRLMDAGSVCFQIRCVKSYR